MSIRLKDLSFTRSTKIAVIGIALLFAFGVILLGLLKDVMIITPLLFYIPILVAAYWFPRRAVILAIIVGAINIYIVYTYSLPGDFSLTYTTATGSFYVLVALSLIISSLSRNVRIQEARYRGIFDHSETGIILTRQKNSDLSIVEVNSRVCVILGYDAAELAGRSLSAFMPEEKIQTLLSEAVKRDGRLPPAESRLEKKDGTAVPVLISGARMPDGMVVLDVTDISERKKTEVELERSLKEKEILLQEVHHRVKNNMQVISGLIELQSAQMKDPETKKLFQESHNRIKTMALIHENLYRSTDYARIDFSSYLDELISDLLSSYGRSRDEIAVDVSLEVTHLDLNMAVPCGLIANELISNALKHAFPGARRGKIAISLGRADGQEYEFSVSDDGIGSPEGLDLKNAESFGFQLIYGLATHQMRGTAELKRGKGTTVTIRFPDLS